MSTQRDHAIQPPAPSTPAQRDGSPHPASTPDARQPPADQDTLVVVPVPLSVAAPHLPARALPPAQRDAVHVAPNLHALVAAGAQADPRETAAEQQRRDLNTIVHSVLIAGLVVSTALMLTGVGLDVFYQRELPTAVPQTGDAIGRVLALRPSGFLALGLLVLIGTPILRVIGSIAAFLYERDWRFAGITTLVLAIVLTGLLLGSG